MARISLGHFKKAQDAATVAQTAFNVASKANPYVLLASAILGVVGAIVAFSGKTDEAAKKVKALNKEVEDLKSGNIEGATEKMTDLEIATKQTIPKIEELSKITNQTATDKELLKKTVDELNDTLGYEATKIEEVNGHLSANTAGIRENIEALKAQAQAEALKDNLKDKYKEKLDAENKIAIEKKKIADAEKVQIQALEYMKKNESNYYTEEIYDIYNEMDGATEKAGESIKLANKEIAKQERLLKPLAEYIKEASTQYDKLSTSALSAVSNTETLWKTLSNTSQSSFVPDVKSMADTLQVLTNAQKEYNDTGKFTTASLEELAKLYPELSSKIDEYATGLISAKDLAAQLPKAYENEKSSYVDNMKQKLACSEAFYRQSILSQSGLVATYNGMYGTDLGSFKTLAQAKSAVEGSLINALGTAWAEYYKSVGSNATKTVEAMQGQINSLTGAKNSINPASNMAKNLDKQIADLKNKMDSLKPITDFEKIEMKVDYSDIEANFDKLLNGSKNKTANTAKQVNDILKDTYDKQLKIAQDYLNQRKKQIDDEYKAKVKKINDGFDLDKKALDEWYSTQKEQAQSAIKAIDDLINAKRKANEVEKLDDSLSFAQNRIETLKRQITYSRGPEEKAELEKELKRQQEELDDLVLQKEISDLEAQRKVHEDNLSNIEERYKIEDEYIKKQREEQLAAIEDAKAATLESLEATVTQFGDKLAATYGYVNEETLAIGKRFANATNGALEGGFTTVANKSKQVMDGMVAQVQEKIRQMNAMMNRLADQYSGYGDGNYSYDSYDNRDNRSMQVTNNITRGLTEGQVSRMMQRQAEDFLYKRR